MSMESSVLAVSLIALGPPARETDSIASAEDLTSDTISDGSSVPTFMQNAVAQKKIPANILGRVTLPD